MNSVYIVGGDANLEQMFILRGWQIAKDYSLSADLILYTGGADVSPELYGERNFASYNDLKRDLKEKRIYEECLELGLPQAGVCRGSQFLTVMNGGKLWQDCTRHAIRGTHPIIDLETGETLQASSTHHQQALPNYETCEVLATANLGGVKHRLDKDGNVTNETDDLDIEAYYYEGTKCLGVQFHPEYGYKECERYFFELLNRKFGF